MSDPGKGHVTLNCPDWNKNFRTDSAHIPRIQKSFNGDRVEPVVLPKDFYDRIIQYPSGMVRDPPSLSFVAFD